MGGGGNGAGTGSWNAASSSLAAALMHTVADSWHTAEQRVSRASQAQEAAVAQRRRQAVLTVLALLAAFSSAAVVLLERFSGQDYPGLAAAALLGACALFLFFLQELPSLAKSGHGGDDIPQTEQSREELLAWMARQSAEAEAQAVASQKLLSESAVTAREPVDWLNKLALRLWPNAIAPAAASDLEAALLHELWHAAPTSVKDVAVEQLSLGETAPQISTTGICWTSLDSSSSGAAGGGRQEGLCAGVEWSSSTLAVQVRLTFADGKAVTLLVSGIQLSGMVRVVPVLHSCGLLWAFAHPPAIRLSVAVAPGQANPSSDALSGVPFWLESCIQSALASHCVEPRRQFLPLTPHPTSALRLPPSHPLPAGPLSLRVTLLRASGLRHLLTPARPDPTKGSPSNATEGGEAPAVEAKEVGFGHVVVELSCAPDSAGPQADSASERGRVVVSSPGVSGPGSSVEFEDGPALLASQVCARGETRVLLRAYALQPKGAAPLLLGSATIDVRVFEAEAGRRYAVAWGLGTQAGEPGEASHSGHPHHRHRKHHKHRKQPQHPPEHKQQQDSPQQQQPAQQQQQPAQQQQLQTQPQQQQHGREQESHGGGGVPKGGPRDDEGLHGSAGVPAVACLKAVGEEQHIAVALEHLQGADWHLGGQIEVALSLTPSVSPGPAQQPGTAASGVGTPGAGHVLRVGVLEAKGLGTGGVPTAEGQKGQLAPAPGVCVRVSCGGESKCTRGVPDANPVWRETLDFECEPDSSPHAPLSASPFFPLSGPQCNGDVPNGPAHPSHAPPSAAAPGALSGPAWGPRFLHLTCLPAKGRWAAGGKGKPLGTAVVDLWALPSLEGPSPVSLWLPLAHPSGTGGEVRVSLHRVASAMARAEQQAARSSRAARPGPPAEGAEGAVLAVLVERAVGLPPKDGSVRGSWGDVYAAVSLCSVTKKTKVVHSGANPEWDEKMWFKWPAPSAPSSLPSPADPSASLDASLEVVVRESLGLSGRAAAAAAAALGGRSTTGAPAAQGAGVIGTGSLALSELEGIREWPHQISIPLSVAMKRAPSLVPIGRRNSDPGLAPPEAPRVALTLARGPSAAEAFDRLYGHVPPLDTTSSNESQTNEAPSLHHSQPSQASQQSQPRSQSQSQSQAQPPSGVLPPVPQPLGLKPETLQQLQLLQLQQQQQHRDKKPVAAAGAAGPAARGAAPGALGAGAVNPRQQRIQRTTAELAACVKTIKDSLGSSSAGSQLAPHLDRLASLAQEQGKLMQSLLADRDLVLRKVAELKSVMGLQAQVAAAAQAQAAAAANSAAPSSVGAAPVPS